MLFIISTRQVTTNVSMNTCLIRCGDNSIPPRQTHMYISIHSAHALFVTGTISHKASIDIPWTFRDWLTRHDNREYRFRSELFYLLQVVHHKLHVLQEFHFYFKILKRKKMQIWISLCAAGMSTWRGPMTPYTPLNIGNIHNIDLIHATHPLYFLTPVNIYKFLLPPITTTTMKCI